MTQPNIKPLSNRILVKRTKKAASKGGILLPDSAQEKPKSGSVIATGPGKIDDDGCLNPMDIKVGDEVLFGAYCGTEVKADHLEDEFLILTEEEVLGILVAKS